MPAIETVITPQGSLPEFDGDLSLWEHDKEVLLAALNQPRGFSYDAQLPEIVGYVPEAEREAMTTILASKGMDKIVAHRTMDADDFAAVEDAMPKTVAIIESDIELISAGLRHLEALEIRRPFIPAGTQPKGANGGLDGLHVDLMVHEPDDCDISTHLVGDLETTLLYEGPAALWYKDNRLRLDPFKANLERATRLVPAPFYAIVRLSGATVHVPPVFAEDARRNLLAFDSE